MSRTKTFIFVGVILAVMVILGIFWGILGKTKTPEQAQNPPPPLSTGLWNSTPTRPAHCVPIPRYPTPAGPPTATPDQFATSGPNLSPTITPIPFAHIYNLSPEMPFEEQSIIVVFRCDGTFDLYGAGPEINIDEYLRLEPGDVIFSSNGPAYLMGHQPPEPTSLTTTP